MGDRTPHARNVPGPFYILDRCCTACMVLHSVAPAMTGFDEQEGHCFVRKQPATAGEFYQAIEAVWVGELGCLRYGGDDPEIVRRLVELGEGSACDRPELTDAIPILRNHVTFQSATAVTHRDIAGSFARCVASAYAPRQGFIRH
jgi:hypothetical protein